MKKPVKAGRLTLTLLCDKMWGRVSNQWFVAKFPEFKGRELVFDGPVELRPDVWQWLVRNRYL